MKKLWRNLRATITDALLNTPVEALIAVFLASVFSLGIENTSENLVVPAFMVGFLALCAVFATSASHALKVFDTKTRWILTSVFGAGAAAYGVGVLDIDLATEVWRWAFLAIAAVMGVMLVPVAARLGDVSASERFWRYNIRLFARTGVAYAYGFALFVGVCIGVAAIDGLFELRIDGDVYGHLFSWIVVGLGTLLAIGSLGEIRRIGEAFAPETLVWSGRLGTFLFMPLVVLYLGIMYVYLGKVVFTGGLPSNILSPLALGAGMLGYFGLFVLQPHMQREDFKPLAAVLRVFPVAFVPVVPFGIYAVWQRVAQYGWTEFRYARMAALVCLGVFSVVGAVKWLRKQEFSLVTGPAILGVVALLGAVGPWGASHVSEVSQLNRFEQALQEANLLENGKLLPPEVVKERKFSAQAEEIRSTAEYLARAHGATAFDELTMVEIQSTEYYEIVRELGIIDLREVPMSLTLNASDRPFEVDRGGTIAKFSVSEHSQPTAPVDAKLRGQELTVAVDGKRGVALLEFDSVQVPFADHYLELPDAERVIPLVDPDSRQRVGSLAISDVRFEDGGDGVARPTYVSGIALLY